MIIGGAKVRLDWCTGDAHTIRLTSGDASHLDLLAIPPDTPTILALTCLAREGRPISPPNGADFARGCNPSMLLTPDFAPTTSRKIVSRTTAGPETSDGRARRGPGTGLADDRRRCIRRSPAAAERWLQPEPDVGFSVMLNEALTWIVPALRAADR